MKTIGWTLGLAVFSFELMGAVRFTQAPYHGWQDGWVLSNGKVEAVIVPSIGRVMQFRFAGEEAGPFWENRAMDGKAVDPNSNEWGNFGGDKSWPSPQSEWPRITGRGWPPPGAFDSMPVEAKKEGDVVILTSSVERHYGIRERRRISLEKDTAQMRIVTEYEKMEGAPIKAGIWIITQLGDPEKVIVPIPKKTLYAQGFNKQSEALPDKLDREGAWISCGRSPKESSKIGFDGGSLIWTDKKFIVWIESPRLARKEYPDSSSSAEVYTNPDPLKYVELEMLGPLKNLKIGDHISQTNTYSLFRRNESPLNEQVAKLLGDGKEQP
jgi:hypothetical protein